MSDMKTLTIGGVTYSIVDETARSEIAKKCPVVRPNNTTIGDATITASIDGLTALEDGMEIILIVGWDINLTPFLNINDLGNKTILAMPIGALSRKGAASIVANRPTRLIYSAVDNAWISDSVYLNMDGVTYGVLSEEYGGTGSDYLDTVPTESETAPITSGGVYSALTGSFAASIKSNDSYQDPATELLRNSKLYTGDTDSTPTVNGVIHWKYE